MPDYIDERNQYRVLFQIQLVVAGYYAVCTVHFIEESEAFGLRPHYVTAVFKKKFHMTPKQYLMELRIEKAKLFILDTEYTLQIIANAVGLEPLFSFSRLFKNVTGFSPAEYRKETCMYGFSGGRAMRNNPKRSFLPDCLAA